MSKKKEAPAAVEIDIIRAGEVFHALKTDAPGALELADKYRARNNGRLSAGAQRQYELYLKRNQ